MEPTAVSYPSGIWTHQPITARSLYRRLRTAAKLDRRGDLSAYLARLMREQALADAMGSGLNIDRIYFAATHQG